MKFLLIVEDSADDVFFLERALEEAGIRVPMTVATDGKMAIDYLGGVGIYADRAAFPLPDVILLDLKMPYIMGLEVLKWIRARSEFKDVKVIVLTSSVQTGDMAEVTELGGNGYLVKPATPEHLRQYLN